MKCPECETGTMESTGYGDAMCCNCGHKTYSESDEDFDRRIYGEDLYKRFKKAGLYKQPSGTEIAS